MKTGIALVVGTLVVTSALVFLVQREARWRRAAYDADTARTNALARADTTRRQLIETADGLRLENERLVEQGHLERRERAGAEAALATARGQIALLSDSVRDLKRQVMATAEPGKDSGTVVITMADRVDTMGIVASAAAVLIIPTVIPLDWQPAPARWTWNLDRQAIALDLELACSGTAAVAKVTGPTWAPVDLVGFRQEPRICAPPPSTFDWEPFGWQAPSLPAAGAIVALTAILTLLLSR